jgi:transposase
MFKLPKDSAVKARTQAVNQLKAVLVVADPALRERLSSLGNRELFRTCAPQSARRRRRWGRRGRRAPCHELNQCLTRLVERHAPRLLIPVGIGPYSAVTPLITMGDNPERLNTKASFAALCGVSPMKFSSGARTSRRLNHGGDRQADAALHHIVSTRLRCDPRTQAYYERRTQEGKTRREIMRCLERYAAREVLHLVRAAPTDPPL